MKVDNLTVKILDSRAKMGKCAAEDIHAKINELLEKKSEINMIFAAAPSQNEALESLLSFKDIDWDRINAFHMDEYIGLSEDDNNKSFGFYLTEHIFSKAPFKSINLINGNAKDLEEECNRYADLLKKFPTDIVIMGIGENGHIAFNDPWVADFNDEKIIKTVALDEVCRNQQVNDGCFKNIKSVPKQALTLTCPTLFSGDNLFCIVPAKTKADAVKRTLNGSISEECPATILRNHKNATLYLDSDSSSKL